ncbi:MAG: hypothetical protein ACFCBU_08935 [Cyanophyceae cyanobacterium]
MFVIWDPGIGAIASTYSQATLNKRKLAKIGLAIALLGSLNPDKRHFKER